MINIIIFELDNAAIIHAIIFLFVLNRVVPTLAKSSTVISHLCEHCMAILLAQNYLLQCSARKMVLLERYKKKFLYDSILTLFLFWNDHTLCSICGIFHWCIILLSASLGLLFFGSGSRNINYMYDIVNI